MHPSSALLRLLPGWLLISCLGLLCGCQRGAPAPKVAAAVTPEGSSPLALPAELAERKVLSPQEETRPVYPPKLVGEADPQAVRFCSAIHGLPSSRRDGCCGGPPGIDLTQECVRVLTYAARDRALTLDAAAIAECQSDLDKALSGCDWVGPLLPELPAACHRVMRGTLVKGARCRSSLECAGSLRCQGAGPVSAGKCDAPHGDGLACGLSVDALASYTRQDQYEFEHPECSGYCGRRHLCEPVRPVGSECVMNSQCGAGNHCGAGRCLAGVIAQLDEPCSSSECASGLRCTGGRCQLPKPAGAVCTVDFECLGGCEKPPTPAGVDRYKAPGRCAPKCSFGY